MKYRGDSIFRRASDVASASSCPSRMIDKAVELWRPRNVLDVGCGIGRAMDYFVERGVAEVYGLEGSPLARSMARQPHLIQEADLSKPVDLGRRFDLAYTVEVAEHIHPQSADVFVQNLTRHADRVLMTAARPGQGGMGHLNEQEPQYWYGKFEAAGYRPDEAAREAIRALRDAYHENVMVFYLA
ncbi:MAG: class I SAM-dependent methyltransferase [Tepidisphaeraceae bacterium]